MLQLDSNYWSQSNGGRGMTLKKVSTSLRGICLKWSLCLVSRQRRAALLQQRRSGPLLSGQRVQRNQRAQNSHLHFLWCLLPSSQHPTLPFHHVPRTMCRSLVGDIRLNAMRVAWAINSTHIHTHISSLALSLQTDPLPNIQSHSVLLLQKMKSL